MAVHICTLAEKLMGDHFDILLIKTGEQSEGFVLSGFDRETTAEV